jgi:glucan phosphoethanolaminetransferase (alkaline phosphatase superfamily)
MCEARLHGGVLKRKKKRKEERKDGRRHQAQLFASLSLFFLSLSFLKFVLRIEPALLSVFFFSYIVFVFRRTVIHVMFLPLGVRCGALSSFLVELEAAVNVTLRCFPLCFCFDSERQD